MFAAAEVEFMGFCVDKDVVDPTTEKVEAIRNAPTPKTKTEPSGFRGLLNLFELFFRGQDNSFGATAPTADATWC